MLTSPQASNVHGPIGEEGDGSTNLYVSEIDPVEVREHLVDLGRVLQDRAGGLSQVVQAGVAPQCLGEGAYTHHLMEREEER